MESLLKLTCNEFLLFISNGWRNKEIIKARQIFHEIFVKNYRNEKGESKPNYSEALFAIANYTLLYHKLKPEPIKDAISLGDK